VRAVTHRIVPGVLHPGGQGLGEVKFPKRSVRVDDTLMFDVKTATPGARDPVALTAGSFVLSAPRTGDVAQTLDLVVTNDSAQVVEGRVDVRVVCLNQAGTPANSASKRLARTELARGATLPTSVDFDLLCPTYVVGAEGRPAR
jgi:hypothetical protein